MTRDDDLSDFATAAEWSERHADELYEELRDRAEDAREESRRLQGGVDNAAQEESGLNE